MMTGNGSTRGPATHRAPPATHFHNEAQAIVSAPLSRPSCAIVQAVLLYAISTRGGNADAVARHARAAFAAGVDWFQIREKTMPAPERLRLTEQVVTVRPAGRKVFVNTHVQTALDAGADGVHLPGGSPPPEAIRRTTSGKFDIGVSCHSLDEALAAEGQGADYIFFSPIFDTPSKRPFGPPQGLDRLRTVCAALTIPVFALGGITEDNARECKAAGAQGVAAIRLFYPDSQLSRRLVRLRENCA